MDRQRTEYHKIMGLYDGMSGLHDAMPNIKVGLGGDAITTLPTQPKNKAKRKAARKARRKNR